MQFIDTPVVSAPKYCLGGVHTVGLGTSVGVFGRSSCVGGVFKFIVSACVHYFCVTLLFRVSLKRAAKEGVTVSVEETISLFGQLLICRYSMESNSVLHLSLVLLQGKSLPVKFICERILSKRPVIV